MVYERSFLKELVKEIITIICRSCQRVDFFYVELQIVSLSSNVALGRKIDSEKENPPKRACGYLRS